MLLLVIVMTSTASARSIAFPEPQNCCQAISAKCEACQFNVTVEEICRVREEDMAFDSLLGPLDGCPQVVDGIIINPKKPKPCCRANTLECQACIAGVSEKEFCESTVDSLYCPQKPDNKPSRPRLTNCYSTIWNKEILHGEMGARKCCWYGKWEHESKCEKNPPITHPDNCYSTIWKKEILHGEMGAKKCCWYGKWEHESKCGGNQPVTHPDNCYSTIWNTEIRHGEMGARKCCWCGGGSQG